MELSLNRLPVGNWGSVVAIDTGKAMQERLKDFGLIPGTRVCRRFCSPHGDVTAIAFRGSLLALRTRDLKKIRVCIS